MSEAQVQRFLELFAGRTDQYAVGYPDPAKPWKYRYAKREQPLTEEVVRRHWAGEEVIGVYSEREGKAKWFAFDFDSPKDDNDQPTDAGIALAFHEAVECRERLLRAGLFTHLERSRSGAGLHLWGFLDEWIDARHLAETLKPLTEGFETLDRGKRYPPLKESKNGVLICFPYSGEAVEQGNGMFLDIDLKLADPGVAVWELPVEDFLARVRVNRTAALERIAPPPTPAPVRDVVPGSDAPLAGEARVPRVTMGRSEGRPAKLGTGIIKMLSPFGCSFMRKVVEHQHDPKLVGEREWYAFLGQLTAFKHGREAAHAIFKRHRHYNARGCDEKFDHAMQSPPVGCAFVHENFPKLACQGCPMTAPYRRGYKSIRELCGETPEDLQRATYSSDLERIRRRDEGLEPNGVGSGIPGTENLFRLRKSEFNAIGAQPSIGKTALMVHMANTISKQTTRVAERRGENGGLVTVDLPIDVATFSLETGTNSFHDRLIAHESGVDSLALRGERYVAGDRLRLSADEFTRIELALDRLRGRPLWENYATANPERILDALEAMVVRRGRPFTDPWVALFDYFQYASGGDAGQVEETDRLREMSFLMKCLTKITEQSFNAFAQLIRESEGAETPKINWWRGTARLEHDMDGGIILVGERMPGRYAPRVAHCVKQREGPVGWQVPLLLEQAVSRWHGKPGDEGEEKGHVLDGEAPWAGADGQLTFAQ